MTASDDLEAYSIRTRPYALLLALLWFAIVSGSLAWNVRQSKCGTLDAARLQARDSFLKDIVYRRWNASHGGVYVPVTDETTPNPYLRIPGREITTRQGTRLTLMNPAYMTRQAHEMAARAYGIRGHITSLNPIRPANAPDPWEVKALRFFESGARETSSVEKMEGCEYMRFMRPLVAEESCLKCHASQGCKLGDIRGGISVAVPMAPLRAVESSRVLALYTWHSLFLAVGLFGVGFGARHLGRRLDAQKRAEQALLRAKLEWERTFDAVPDMITVLDDQHRILRANRSAAETLGMSTEELVGSTCYECMHGTVTPPARCPHAFLLADGQEHTAEIYEETLDRDLLVTVAPLHDEVGRVTGSVHVARDITQRKRDEEVRRKLNLLNESLIVSGELGNKLRRVTDSVVAVFGADFARIWMVGPGDLCDSGCIHAGRGNGLHMCRQHDTCLHLVASSGRYAHINGDHRRIPCGVGKIGGIAWGTDVEYVTNDVAHAPGVHDHQWAEELGLKAFAGFRLFCDSGDPVGVLALFSRHHVSADTAGQLQGLANTTSQVIQNSLKEKALSNERDKLRAAMERIKVLRGLLPICASCKKIRDDRGYWNHIESYIREHSEAEFSHGICPDCARELYPAYMAKIGRAKADETKKIPQLE